ncbi:hypothetical protein KAFR_0E01820 [Kazachstania africana CBS 2517]|uniref:ATP-dependent DNA helicase RRM3 n=1 Tax=Kazachstania africana (strain ATCC 22294 / BCRC 22015 / CBS 2517 / CECT 1963 / NBRC 1671 / NRRL Y-8276) TaxID=1071382 RepID=H2AVD6_KAZAF|nr:hypothetical protein KAFR_0E01820 [Kazachstania africana CBS 2517]CCF58336.1 hypothetical protein KAFR_0E01820 [Kazachstania africana CBS 2517]
MFRSSNGDSDKTKKQRGLKQKTLSSYFFQVKPKSQSFDSKSQSTKANLATKSKSFKETRTIRTKKLDTSSFTSNKPYSLFQSQGSFDECDTDAEVKKLMDVPHINNFKQVTTISRSPSFHRSPEKSQRSVLEDLADDMNNLREVTNIKVGHRRLAFTSTQIDTTDLVDTKPTKRIGSFQDLKIHTSKRIKPIQRTTSNLKSNKVTIQLKLTKEQETVVDLIVNKRLNVFYTGSAGTGKSVILQNIIEKLRSMYGKEAVAITASTGLAAATIGGVTLHKWSYAGIGNRPPDVTVKKIQRLKEALAVWKNTKVLIIDEISMIDGKFLNMLEYIARAVRKNDKPFGGIQLVLTGDFFQLPPVQKKDDVKASIFCFESEMWKRCIHKTILLTKVFRQHDSELIDILNSIRFGELQPHMISTVKNLQREVDYSDGIYPTELYATRREVELSNSRQLGLLPGDLHQFESVDLARKDQIQLLDSSVMAERVVTLKENAQVMMLKNKPEVDLFNGSLGKVLFFTTERLHRKMLELFKVIDDNVIADMRLVSQVIANPLRRQSKEFIQDFNARTLSRAEILEELVNVAILESPVETAWPYVRWSTGKNRYYHELVLPDRFPVDIPGDKTGIERTQVPIMLCWALSIHKAQGQTIQRLKVDLKNIFEAGQVYVALSRAVSKDQLQVLNFNPKKITTNEKVKDFYKQLETVKA